MRTITCRYLITFIFENFKPMNYIFFYYHFTKSFVPILSLALSSPVLSGPIEHLTFILRSRPPDYPRSMSLSCTRTKYTVHYFFNKNWDDKQILKMWTLLDLNQWPSAYEAAATNQTELRVQKISTILRFEI